MSEQLETILREVMQSTDEDDKQIEIIDEDTLQIKTQIYRLVENYREGFQKEAFMERYQEFFEKYDFIFGDWGHEQLRLRGFYQLGRRKVPFDQQINFLDDYIKEYCNFGCAYFLIAKEEAIAQYEKMDKKTSHKPHTHKKSQNKVVEREKPTSNSRKKTHRKFNKRKMDSSQNSNPSKTRVTEKKKGSNFVIKKIKKD